MKTAKEINKHNRIFWKQRQTQHCFFIKRDKKGLRLIFFLICFIAGLLWLIARAIEIFT
jgi:fumarate reductase subunit C